MRWRREMSGRLTGRPKADRRKRPLWQKLLGALGIWIALIYVEGKVIAHLDQKVRADRAIFLDYVARLPNPIIFPFDERITSFCEQPRIWGLWTYQICLYKTEYTGEGSPSNPCPSPNFGVDYTRPNYITLPDLPKWRRTPFILERDKTICDEFDISLEH